MSEELATPADWISVLQLAPGSNGLDGGPWSLTVTRASDPGGMHWWPLSDVDEVAHGLSVSRTRGGDVVQVTVAGDSPFQEAAIAYGLHPDVFGSPTLWPSFHQDATGTARGWVWKHPARSAPFPMRESH